MTTYIYEGLRTPFGKYGKGLADIRPDDLLAGLLKETFNRHDCDPALVDDVIMGNANGAGEENRNVARMSWLLAGFPVSVPGVTVNRLCGSGMEAIIQGSRAIEAGDASLIVAGGVESMSRAPYVMLKPDRAFPAGPATLESTTIGWRLVNPNMPTQWTIGLGNGAEILADRYNISRQAQDECAYRSHERAAAAWAEGRMEREIVQVGVDLERDETIRATTMESLAKLRPAFEANGTVTAGNSSSLNDGASLVVLGDDTVEGFGDPLARIVSRGAAGVSPEVFGIGPVEAAEQALERAGLTWDDIDLVELNEAFAAQALACLTLWPDLDPTKVNVDGGAIAIGHPLGASGGRIVAHLVHSLRARGGRYGMAVICIGVGQGLAIIVEAQ